METYLRDLYREKFGTEIDETGTTEGQTSLPTTEGRTSLETSEEQT